MKNGEPKTEPCGKPFLVRRCLDVITPYFVTQCLFCYITSKPLIFVTAISKCYKYYD